MERRSVVPDWKILPEIVWRLEGRLDALAVDAYLYNVVLRY